MEIDYPVGQTVEEAEGVQLGDLLEGERVQAFLRLDSASVAPEVLAAVGPYILAVEDVPWILQQYGRRGGSRRERRGEGVLARAVRLGLRPSAREWFWPVWLAALDTHEHNTKRRWGALKVCLNFCGFSVGGAVSTCPCAVPVRALMLKMECAMCAQDCDRYSADGRWHSAGFHYRHLRTRHGWSPVASNVALMKSLASDVVRESALLRDCPYSHCAWGRAPGWDVWRHVVEDHGDVTKSWELAYNEKMAVWKSAEVTACIQWGPSGLWWRNSVTADEIRGAAEAYLEYAHSDSFGGVEVTVTVPITYWP